MEFVHLTVFLVPILKDIDELSVLTDLTVQELVVCVLSLDTTKNIKEIEDQINSSNIAI